MQIGHQSPRHALPLRVISAAVVLMLITACSSSPKSAAVPASSSSPFYTSAPKGSAGIHVNTLRTFGDSYTDFGYTDPRAQKNWSRELVNSGLAAQQENYAVGGARALSGTPDSFDNQIARWDSANSPTTERDLSIAYFGYNDIGRGGNNLAPSKASYSRSINYLLARGAADGNNRIFVTQITDWSDTPGISDSLRGQVIDWNNHVASVANSNPNIVAVDLFTVFNRVRDNPGAFGLVNATDIGKLESYTNYLYFDSLHFGTKGQEIIARVFSHYLTRGWNWASALDAGGTATAQLNKDLDSNLLAFQYSQKFTPNGSFRFLPLTTTENALAKPARNGYRATAQSFESVKPMGLALDFGSVTNPAGNGRMGLAFTHGAQSDKVSSFDERSSMRFNSSATTLYWMKPHANFLFSTQMSRINHGFDQTGQDDLINSVVSNERNGHTWSLEGKARYTHRANGFTLTPWASLSQQSHTLNGGTLKSIYTTDVRFSATKANDLYGGIGLDMQFDPLSLSNGKKLHLAGGIHHTQSIKRDSLLMQMREQISSNVTSTEIIQRPGIRQTQLGLNAQLEVSKQVHLNAVYAVDLQNPRSSQAIRLMAGVRF